MSGFSNIKESKPEMIIKEAPHEETLSPKGEKVTFKGSRTKTVSPTGTIESSSSSPRRVDKKQLAFNEA